MSPARIGPARIAALLCGAGGILHLIGAMLIGMAGIAAVVVVVMSLLCLLCALDLWCRGTIVAWSMMLGVEITMVAAHPLLPRLGGAPTGHRAGHHDLGWAMHGATTLAMILVLLATVVLGVALRRAPSHAGRHVGTRTTSRSTSEEMA